MNTTISCASLEQPGNWRIVGVVLVLLVVTLPALPLLWHTITTTDAMTWPFSGTFGSVLGNSVLVALTVAAVSLLFGLPVGVLVTFYEFPGRKILLALATLPLLVPSVLWAIGWSALVARLAPTATDFVSGITGCAFVFSMTTIPLVLLTSYAATMGLSASQVDSARLAGGERRVFWYAARHAAIPALLAALLGGVLTLSDPGPGQILGLRTAASEILISFSALYDFSLAAQQCVALTALVLIFAAPLAYFAGSRIASGMLARQTRRLRRVRHKTMATATIVVLTAFVLVGVITPMLGLTLPVRVDGEMFRRALSELGRTAGDTVLYATGAGAIAVLLGFLLTFFVGRQVRLKTVTLGAAFALFSLPPALTSLGLIYLGTDAPAWADPLFRSRLTVCLALGLRFFPVSWCAADNVSSPSRTTVGTPNWRGSHAPDSPSRHRRHWHSITFTSARRRLLPTGYIHSDGQCPRITRRGPVPTLCDRVSRTRRPRLGRRKSLMNQGFELRAVSKNYHEHVVLSEVSLTVPVGQHTAILGTSGCGKSTVLRILSGLDAPSGGEVLLNGAVISQANRVLVPPHRRGVAMVFQDLALWPNLSVLDNVLLGQSGTGLTRREAQVRAGEALALCGIEPLAKRQPGELSGGQQQRVALARSLATQPTFLFLDEPFSGLDLVTKTMLLNEISLLAEQRQLTIVLVSHDPTEVTALCRSAVVLDLGKVKEAGELSVLMRQPRTEISEKNE